MLGNAGMALRRSSPRLLVVVALAVWLLISAYMLVVLGEELDMDSVFYMENPFSGSSITISRTVTYGPTYVPPPANPRPAVVAAFVAVGFVVGLPAFFSRRCFSRALKVSAILTGLVLVAAILRLGILLVPVLALQLWALSRSRDTKRQ